MTDYEIRWKIYNRLGEINHWINSDISPEIRRRYDEEKKELYAELVGLELMLDDGK